MNTEQRKERPPRWAEGFLRLLLKAQDRDSVSGDLLEEYRESIVPVLGWKADVWYLQQVGWLLLRHTLLPGALIGATLVVRYLVDMLAPVIYTPGVIHPRSRIMSWTIMMVFAMAAAHAVWRTSRIGSGLIVALTSAILGGIFSSAATAIMLAIWHDPATLRAWQTSGGLGEALWGIPLLLLPISAITSTAGALLSRLMFVRRSHSVCSL